MTHRNIVSELVLSEPRVVPGPGAIVSFRVIFDAVIRSGKYNFAGARLRVPSGLRIPAWHKYLEDYADHAVPDYLEFGWPINHDRVTPLQSTADCHPSAKGYAADIEHYIAVERSHGALLGPFGGPPVDRFHMSPLMTRHKRDSEHRRVILDLSWPHGAAVNDGIPSDFYIDGTATIILPTADYMADRIIELGPGAQLYKSDLARGYRQLRVDPWDWPLLGFTHGGHCYMDVCPPFGLKTSAMFMQRTSQAICFIHGKRGFLSRAYLDDFGGAEKSSDRAAQALHTLQGIMNDLGVREAPHKVCAPSTCMIWLGIMYDTIAMTMTIPEGKMAEVMGIVSDWEHRIKATRKEVQSLLGLLQFVASVSPPVRVFTNRMLNNLREMPHRGRDTLSLGFKRDLEFFRRLLPQYNGVRILDKSSVDCQEHLELDACLTGCGATTGDHYYSEVFPDFVLQGQHQIEHLELLNVVVAVKVWQEQWAGSRVKVSCDNMNACLAIQSGRSRDPFVQSCVRELFFVTARRDIELWAVHCPGKDMGRADALSRMHLAQKYVDIVNNDTALQRAHRVRVPQGTFSLTFDP